MTFTTSSAGIDFEEYQQAPVASQPPAPEVEELTETTTEEQEKTPWKVILFNDEIHTFDEVIVQIVKATGCSSGRAEELAWEVHTTGKACVYEGEFEECLRVQGVLREIELVTEIQG